MPKRILERYWKPQSGLSEHKVVSDVLNEIRHDIRAGQVFPALRENEIHLYHNGGRVLRIRPEAAYSHGQYAYGSGTADVSLREPLTKEMYELLKTRCSAHNGRCLKNIRRGYRETWIVSRLFERYSVWADGAAPNQPKLIDVEVRLRGGKGRSVEMVDLLFLDDDACLIFVEVKRQYDSRVRSRDSVPEVVSQVRGYETALQQHHRSVLAAYRDVGNVVSRAFGFESKGFEAPKRVLCRVPILVCRRDDISGWDRWLQARLATCETGEVDPKYLVVDGGAVSNPEAVYDGNQPPWCADGMWENIDLRMLFAKIRSGRSDAL